MSKKHKRERKHLNANKGGDFKATASSTVISEAFQGVPLEVKVYANGFDRALKAFRSLVQKERVLTLYKEKGTYEKKSDKDRRKRNEAKRKQEEIDHPRDEERQDKYANS